MFDGVTYANSVLQFHTSATADQAGAVTTLRQAGVAFTPDTVSIGKYGPFPLPAEFRETAEFQRLMELNDHSIRVSGASKSPRKRPDWPILTYAYRLYAAHDGIATDAELPPSLVQMVESKRLLWNALCQRCSQAIEAGQTVTGEVLDALSAETGATLTTFNDSLGRSKDKIAFPKDDPKLIPAQRVRAFARFTSRLHHLSVEGKPVPDGLERHVAGILEEYPYDWSHFREFERRILTISAELIKDMAIPASIAAPVISTYRSTFKRRRTMKLKGFDGIPHPKDAGQFNWFHEFSFGSGGVKVSRMNAQGSSSLRFGTPVSPAVSGHPEMKGRHATRRTLRPITFTIEGQEVTFAMMMHRTLPENGLLKMWRLLYRDGEFWVNFMLEIPPYVNATPKDAGGAGLDLNWRVLPHGGILVGMLADGSEDYMIVFDMDRSPLATDQGGMIQTSSEGGFRVVSVGVGPSRWGRNNVLKGVNYGVPDTFAGARTIRQLRDKAKDELKNRIAAAMGEKAPTYLSRCGIRGLKQMAKEVEASHPLIAADILAWDLRDQDFRRVTTKLSDLLDGRIKRGYEQLAHHLCRKLSGKGIRRIAIEENFLKVVAQAEKKYQPEALQNSARYRHAVGASGLISTMEHIGAKYGIVLSRRNAAYTTTRCRFCGAKCNFRAKRTAQCPGCSRVIDQDQNAAHNLRNAELAEDKNSAHKAEVRSVPDFTWTLTIGRVSPEGELRQKRVLALISEPKGPLRQAS